MLLYTLVFFADDVTRLLVHTLKTYNSTKKNLNSVLFFPFNFRAMINYYFVTRRSFLDLIFVRLK